MGAARPVFNDQIVSATFLNRHSGSVLDQALLGPVTIMRNDEAFALMARPQASRLTGTAAHAEVMIDILDVACRNTGGRPIDQTHRFEWVAVFSPEETREMTDEILRAFRRSDSGETDWEEFDAVLHEWEESAWALRNRPFELTPGSPGEEVPLTPAQPDSEA